MNSKKQIHLTEQDINKMVMKALTEELDKRPRTSSFAKDDRISASGYTHKSANMPNPAHDDKAPYMKGMSDYYAAPDRDSETMHKDIDRLNKSIKDKQRRADKRWMKSADTRPLHRKGSLNRLVGEAIKKVVNELTDNSFNREDHRKMDMMADFNTAEFPRKYQMPILNSEGNGEVYRADAFTQDWRDNPTNDPTKTKAPYTSYVWNKQFSPYYPKPEDFWNKKDTRAYKYTKDLDKINRDKDWFKRQQAKMTQRALQAADERPLHRKGSLNRALESTIRNTVSKILREGGHLYRKDAEGNVHTNSKETYRGVEGSTFIWHGEWADPTILWKGKELNGNDVEEYLFDEYKETCNETGETPTTEGFDKWAETQDIAAALDELLWAMHGNQ